MRVVGGGRKDAAAGAVRRCPACGEGRPVEHQYCHACGARLGEATLAANVKGFKQRGLGMGYGRIHTRSDRLGEAPLRTWADLFARWYVTATLLAVGVLYASSRGYLPAAWWDGVKALLLR